MEQYNFKNLEKDLTMGHEIEFGVNGKEYSITNSVDGYWYLFCDSEQKELLKICKFHEKKELVEKVSQFKICENSIKEIFDKSLYDADKLVIL